jgi:biopolymer transport protein ExbB
MLSNFNWLEAMGTSPVFLVLVACSIVTLAVAIERAAYYWKRGADPTAAFTNALERVRAGDLKEATWACTSCRHPMGAVASQVLQQPESATREMEEERLVVALSEQRLLLERNLAVLGTMAATAPFIGLLGTVWGIMRAFHDMALAGSAGPTVVAAGVAEALMTTAAGLVVAVPAVFLYNHFTRRMNVMLTVAENHARGLKQALASSPRAVARAA